ncbi:hypothetical protein J1C56_02470 [Aminobacter anthyllidis]|uniref:Uncharacterized protein n=1 Tax=Aminobacter anthyllidis TaxID=1035067 RepID=A0A9X1A715_9HYPH|nr:hypothetical protein [Aminobacter anthyllidis]MBT1154449.1 hypothetical protein [Aminobacter anthyllidis]
MLNASNFSRNFHVNAAKLSVLAPTQGNRKSRRYALAVARQAIHGGEVLDRFNDTQVDGSIHPTKGWRGVSPKRSIAATIANMMKLGFSSTNLESKEALQDA